MLLLVYSPVLFTTCCAALRQPFTPPGADEFVRVRTQHYQGEAHPADRKAVITLRASSISLRGADKAAHKLRLLAGAHWDSDKDELKIACERFGTKAQNERWCSETLDRLVAAAEVRTFLLRSAVH